MERRLQPYFLGALWHRSPETPRAPLAGACFPDLHDGRQCLIATQHFAHPTLAGRPCYRARPVCCNARLRSNTEHDMSARHHSGPAFRPFLWIIGGPLFR